MEAPSTSELLSYLKCLKSLYDRIFLFALSNLHVILITKKWKLKKKILINQFFFLDFTCIKSWNFTNNFFWLVYNKLLCAGQKTRDSRAVTANIVFWFLCSSGVFHVWRKKTVGTKLWLGILILYWCHSYTRMFPPQEVKFHVFDASNAGKKNWTTWRFDQAQKKKSVIIYTLWFKVFSSSSVTLPCKKKAGVGRITQRSPSPRVTPAWATAKGTRLCAEWNHFFLFREIHRMVEWLVSESMVMYYIHLFRDSTWPGGELAKLAAQRTEVVSIFLKSFIGVCFDSIFSILFLKSVGNDGRMTTWPVLSYISPLLFSNTVASKAIFICTIFICVSIFARNH